MAALCGFYGGYTIATLRDVPLREIDALKRYMIQHYEAMGG